MRTERVTWRNLILQIRKVLYLCFRKRLCQRKLNGKSCQLGHHHENAESDIPTTAAIIITSYKIMMQNDWVESIKSLCHTLKNQLAFLHTLAIIKHWWVTLTTIILFRYPKHSPRSSPCLHNYSKSIQGSRNSPTEMLFCTNHFLLTLPSRENNFGGWVVHSRIWILHCERKQSQWWKLQNCW